jgi:hypothetical protein
MGVLLNAHRRTRPRRRSPLPASDYEKKAVNPDGIPVRLSARIEG